MLSIWYSPFYISLFRLLVVFVSVCSRSVVPSMTCVFLYLLADRLERSCQEFALFIYNLAKSTWLCLKRLFGQDNSDFGLDFSSIYHRQCPNNSLPSLIAVAIFREGGKVTMIVARHPHLLLLPQCSLIQLDYNSILKYSSFNSLLTCSHSYSIFTHLIAMHKVCVYIHWVYDTMSSAQFGCIL